MDVKIKSIQFVLACLLGMYHISYCGAACDRGWFGDHCEYLCRCPDNCDNYGRCNKCSGLWFGPSCQYASLIYNASDLWRLVTDYNDDTCVQNLQQTSVTVRLWNQSPFSWLRVHLKYPNFLHNLTVHFKWDHSLPCINQRSSVVDDRTLDIHCDIKEAVEFVTLTGEGVQYLCSLHISGGRNVALRQVTSQSSNYSDAEFVYSSDKAVDGYTNPDFRTGFCSRTKDTLRPSWTLKLSKPYNISRFVIYNRYIEQDKITGFTLNSFSGNNVKVFSYTDTETSGLYVYYLTAESMESSVSMVTIQLNRQNDLVLCEVEAYGDSACQPKRYGRDCEHRCNCAGDESCFVSTGGCPSGCADGYQGEACDKVCSVGKFGKDCSMNCCEFCQPPATNDTQDSPCHHQHGQCVFGCQNGYEGVTCSVRVLPVVADDGSKTTIIAGITAGIAGVFIIIAVVVSGVLIRCKFRNFSLYHIPDYTGSENHHYHGIIQGDGYLLPSTATNNVSITTDGFLLPSTASQNVNITADGFTRYQDGVSLTDNLGEVNIPQEEEDQTNDDYDDNASYDEINEHMIYVEID